ncbi:hypothetical protein SARC_00538 [Sphaeroforma arctica JP610]|uniref:Uncharacterized protein n=1 Tax=Sphaeroforma arctica JP610 TaxID=667725 RepID=A0A0L0GGB4_9EUKA|nr:hypothetical protein SARC_00538 [Sphaeroforma arctica JP610]KNC87348.1 hypothetical protein SARC_00538 [Sphaeroforma arctica JP610]|eukprot:XP_014161250.1 hypothetical protein SARC_00538 [Sphaeroforma arctica JP610]
MKESKSKINNFNQCTSNSSPINGVQSTSLLQKIENIGTCLADLEQIDLAGEQQDEIIQERICTIEENNKKIERYRKLAVFQQLEKFSSEKQDAEEDVKMATDDS